MNEADEESEDEDSEEEFQPRSKPNKAASAEPRQQTRPKEKEAADKSRGATGEAMGDERKVEDLDHGRPGNPGSDDEGSPDRGFLFGIIQRRNKQAREEQNRKQVNARHPTKGLSDHGAGGDDGVRGTDSKRAQPGARGTGEPPPYPHSEKKPRPPRIPN